MPLNRLKSSKWSTLHYVAVLFALTFLSLLGRWAAWTPQRVTFFVIGDFGVDDEDPIFADALVKAKRVARTMYEIASWYDWPRAVLMTGDIAYPSGVSSPGDDRVERVFDRIPYYFRNNVDFYAVPGNHDCEGSISIWLSTRRQIKNWKLPQGGGSLYGENIFQLPWGGKLRLISLETCSLVCTPATTNEIANHRCGLAMSKYSTDPLFRKHRQEQLEWMKKLPDKPKDEWRIVMGHWSIFSFRGNGPTKELENVLQWMREKQVDIYFSGHDHALQYIQASNPEDPLFFVSGAGGYPLHSTMVPESFAQFNAEHGAELIKVQDDNGFIVMDVFQNQLLFKFFDDNGTQTFQTALSRDKLQTN